MNIRARADPDKFTYGSAGNGSVNRLLGEMLKVELDVRVAPVPYLKDIAKWAKTVEAAGIRMN